MPVGVSFLICRRLAVLSIACLAALLLACDLAYQHPFRVGTNVWPGYEPLHLAAQMGAYRDSPIKMVEMANASSVMQALRNGTLEAAALTLDEALTLVQDNHDLRVVLVMDFSRGGDALVAHPDIASLTGLKGQRVGVENTAVGAILLDAALHKAGITVADFDLIELTIDEQSEAFLDGEIDAVVTFEPVRSELLRMGANVLFDSSEIPDRIVDVLVVRADVAGHHDATLRTLIEGYFDALAFLREQPGAAALKIARRLQVDASEVPTMYLGLYQPDAAENHELLGAKAGGLNLSVRRLSELMLQQGMLDREPDISRLLSARWLPDRQ